MLKRSRISRGLVQNEKMELMNGDEEQQRQKSAGWRFLSWTSKWKNQVLVYGVFVVVSLSIALAIFFSIDYPKLPADYYGTCPITLDNFDIAAVGNLFTLLSSRLRLHLHLFHLSF